jgi:3-hydroxyisobutyrate dehydrogenase-like beta-hydroxyacid dehydrogenase
MLKDMRLAARIPGGDALPVLAAVRDRLAQADRAGYADEDFSALMKLLK